MCRRSQPFDIVGRSASVAVLATALCLCAPAALAQDANVQDSVTAETETPWYEAFTLSLNEAPNSALNGMETYDWESPGGRWGITLGIQDRSASRFATEDVSAGAFVNRGDRFRLGGELRFTSPDSEFFNLRETEADRREPEVKFESALRF